MKESELLGLVRDVPNFPQRGIMFKDLTPVMASAGAFSHAVKSMSAPWREVGVDVVVGVEARGFIFGAAVARELGVGFVPARKTGKLPWMVREFKGKSEYGDSHLEIHSGATCGLGALVVDDVLATGGTLHAVSDLLRADGARLLGYSVFLEIAELKGRDRVAAGVPVRAVLKV